MSLSHRLRQKIFACFLLTATACVAPSQDFEPGSDYWLRANPELSWISEAAESNLRHQVLVAVLDGGFDLQSPQLRRNFHIQWNQTDQGGRNYGIGIDLLGGDRFPHFPILSYQEGTPAGQADDLSPLIGIHDHGTHVSQLAMLSDPRLGLIPIRVLPIVSDDRLEMPNSETDMSPSAIAFKDDFFRRSLGAIEEGIDQAIHLEAKVLNLSIGLNGETLPSSLRKKILEPLLHRWRAKSTGEWSQALLVAAAGNESATIHEGFQSIPATLPLDNLISVGALSEKNQAIAYYSNIGPKVDVYVRGSNLVSAVPVDAENITRITHWQGARARMSGTSMAAPLVAHLAAEILLILPELNGAELKQLMISTADVRALAIQPDTDNPKNTRTSIETVRVLNPSRAMATARAMSLGSSSENRKRAPKT